MMVNIKTNDRNLAEWTTSLVQSWSKSRGASTIYKMTANLVVAISSSSTNTNNNNRSHLSRATDWVQRIFHKMLPYHPLKNTWISPFLNEKLKSIISGATFDLLSKPLLLEHQRPKPMQQWHCWLLQLFCHHVAHYIIDVFKIFIQ